MNPAISFANQDKIARGTRQLVRLCALLAAGCALATAPAQAASAPPVSSASLVVGDRLTVVSTIMGEPRDVAIMLPAGYAQQPERRFPVLYLIDGGVDQDLLHIAGTTHLNALWGRSQPVIVVGVATKDRRAELTGPTADPELLKQYPTAGGSARFRAFIRDEVMPLVEARYRSNGTRGVIGESLAGLFIVESALDDPTLFQRHAAISPSMWWDTEALSQRAAGLLAGRTGPRALYLSIANEGDEMRSGFDRLAAALEDADWRGCALARPDLTHATIYHALSPQALQYLFPVASDEPPMEGFEPPCASSDGDAPT